MAVAKNVTGVESSMNTMPGGTLNLKTRVNQMDSFSLTMIRKADTGLTSPMIFVLTA